MNMSGSAGPVTGSGLAVRAAKSATGATPRLSMALL